MSILERLEKIGAKQHLARFTRASVAPEHDHGFVLGVSPSLVLYENEEDFLLNGYRVIRVGDLTAVRCGRYDRYCERMMRGEGVSPGDGLAHTPDLASWRTLLAGLKRSGILVIVECETGDPVEDAFYIGRIERVDRSSVALRHFDALGWWDDEPTRIAFDAITRVRFGERYIEVFAKYLRWRDEPPN